MTRKDKQLYYKNILIIIIFSNINYNLISLHDETFFFIAMMLIGGVNTRRQFNACLPGVRLEGLCSVLLYLIRLFGKLDLFTCFHKFM